MKPTYNLLQIGVGAVLYFPNCFYKDVLREDLFLKLANNTDDLWFWVMAILNNTKIKLANNSVDNLNTIENTQDTALYLSNCDEGINDKNIK